MIKKTLEQKKKEYYEAFLNEIYGAINEECEQIKQQLADVITTLGKKSVVSMENFYKEQYQIWFQRKHLIPETAFCARANILGEFYHYCILNNHNKELEKKKLYYIRYLLQLRRFYCGEFFYQIYMWENAPIEHWRDKQDNVALQYFEEDIKDVLPRIRYMLRDAHYTQQEFENIAYKFWDVKEVILAYDDPAKTGKPVDIEKMFDFIQPKYKKIYDESKNRKQYWKTVKYIKHWTIVRNFSFVLLAISAILSFSYFLLTQNIFF